MVAQGHHELRGPGADGLDPRPLEQILGRQAEKGQYGSEASWNSPKTGLRWYIRIREASLAGLDLDPDRAVPQLEPDLGPGRARKHQTRLDRRVHQRDRRVTRKRDLTLGREIARPQIRARGI